MDLSKEHAASIVVALSTLPDLPADMDPECRAEEQEMRDLCGLNGRVIYYEPDDGYEEEYDTYDEFGFLCGPETAEGYLYDQHCSVCGTALEELFKDMPCVEIMASENAHVVTKVEGHSAKELWDFIKQRLILSGVQLHP